VRRDRSVFINCPYDEEYLPLFDAIIFATIACSYTPRSALESGDVSRPRMERIFKALASSKYSIHDFSRCKGEGDLNLARFNMPLEFGIAFGKAYLKVEGRQLHDWLVLLPQGHFYRTVVSDLGAYDVPTHAGTVDSVVTPVLSWLLTRQPKGPRNKLTPRKVLAAMPEFSKRLDERRAEWHGSLLWKDWLDTAREVARASGLIAPAAVPVSQRRTAKPTDARPPVKARRR
jgi:hypothetical protein